MSKDTIQSPAFLEFIQKRCEEIIINDGMCYKINKEILELEKELLSLLSEEAKSKFLKIDELNLEFINRIQAITTPIILR
jgi:hypothetical protein